MKDKLILSAYGSHNASICMYYKGEFTVIEIERWLNSKNIGLTTYMPAKHSQIVFDEITEFLLSKTDRSDVDIFLTDYVKVIPKFFIKEYIDYDHHTAHAATAFYQSPYKEALVFTFDGGGDGAFFNVYLADRNKGLTLIEKFNQDLGFPYMIIGDYLADIKKEALTIGNLVYAGKLMGLVSYGKVRPEWLPAFNEFYTKFSYGGNSYLGGKEASYSALTKLFADIGFEDFNYETSRYEGQLAWDLAATSQQAFEDQFFKLSDKFLKKYKELPVALAGGCALNVLLNTKLLKQRNNKVFVPPNVNDCGIAVGGLLWYLKPEQQVDLTYSGMPIIDKNQFGTYIQEYDLVVHEDIEVEDLAKYIADGNIVGMIQGNSEHGSRALGNRSIICNPAAGMKDTLNNKVKHREWYRPFAPMVRLEDCPTYFEFDEGVESRHMVYVATVREEWRDKIPAITHEDNTGRLQTVTEAQNKLIYDLLGEVGKITGHSVLLNTSFNVDGKPILTRLSDAFKILRDTQLDSVYFEGKLIVRHTNDNFVKIKEHKESIALKDETTVYISSFTDDADTMLHDIDKMKSYIKEDRKIVAVIPQTHQAKYLASIPESDNFKYHIVEYRREHYYDSRMRSGKFKLNKESTADFSKYLTLFWLRDAVINNYYQTKYHLCVNLNELNHREYHLDINREIELLSEFAVNDEQVVITSKKDISSIFDADYLFKRFGVEDIKKMPTTALFCGNLANVVWMCQNYEGMLLQYMDMEKVGDDHDYLLISTIENESRYKFLDA